MPPTLVLLIAALANGASAAEPSLQVTDEGVGPILRGSWPDQASLRQWFPDAKLKKGDDSSEGEKVGEHLAVIEGGQTVLLLHRQAGSRKLFSIEVLAKSAVGPGGLRIGDSLAKLDPDGASCAAGEEEDSDFLFCSRKSAPHVFFVSPAEGWPAAGGKFPSTQAREKFKIAKIVWTAAAEEKTK